MGKIVIEKENKQNRCYFFVPESTYWTNKNKNGESVASEENDDLLDLEQFALEQAVCRFTGIFRLRLIVGLALFNFKMTLTIL